jgi:quercetin dioxygenase-like cupin family protein
MAFTIEGKEIMLESGMAITIAPNQMHGARAITDCRLIDVFCPAREDYK